MDDVIVVMYSNDEVNVDNEIDVIVVGFAVVMVHSLSPLLFENSQPQCPTCIMNIQWLGKMDIYNEIFQTTHDELSRAIVSKPR